MYKAWIVIVTCSSSRALYLDVVENCLSASCVNMLKWFINQYGEPKQVLSDNGSAFTSKQRGEETQYFIWYQMELHSRSFRGLVDFSNAWYIV